eukprot:Lankesteria_metandrocarpae@DN5285_c0_g1_i1.p1
MMTEDKRWLHLHPTWELTPLQMKLKGIALRDPIIARPGLADRSQHAHSQYIAGALHSRSESKMLYHAASSPPLGVDMGDQREGNPSKLSIKVPLTESTAVNNGVPLPTFKPTSQLLLERKQSDNAKGAATPFGSLFPNPPKMNIPANSVVGAGGAQDNISLRDSSPPAPSK